jgi:DNA-binding NarL/FixJ family response regulator
MTISVIIADDHLMIRNGIKAIIKSETDDIIVVGETSNGQEMLEMSRVVKCDVYIIDITMPILDGIDTLRALLKESPDARAIILSVHSTREYVERSLLSGAKGYVLKNETSSGLITALREVHSGCFYLSPKVTNFIIESFISRTREKQNIMGLTQREREILQLITEGSTNREIGENLSISLHTVNTHRKNIMRKLDIHKHADLVRFAIKAGIAVV